MGSVSAMRNGAEVTLKIGDPIYKSDIIQTASGSSVGITFPDGTALHITANARMALSDYSFDANSTTNGAFFHLIDGTFSFVAGQVARTGGLKIETPVGTVGIRGTTGWVQQVATVSATLGNTTYSFAVVQDQNSDHTGVYDVLDGAGNAIATISQQGILTLVSGQGIGQQLLVTTQQMTDAQLAFEQQIIQAVFNVATGLTTAAFRHRRTSSTMSFSTTTRRRSPSRCRMWMTSRSSALPRLCGRRRSCRRSKPRARASQTTRQRWIRAR
jgi:enamine deaminase RidA (YjgF/YER057c/UK114 family)